MSITPLRFTGVSNFSDDLQAVVDRAVSIASIPILGMQNDQADLLSKKTVLGELNSTVATLATRIEALGALGASKAVNATSSNTGRVTVTANSTAAPGLYTITDISSIATAASATSSFGYATSDETQVSADGILELAVGNQRFTIDLTEDGSNNLEGLRDAINNLEAGVTATVINTGTGENPYFLSLSSDSTGRQAFELRETAGQASTNLLANASATTEAAYSSESGFSTSDATAVSDDGVLQLMIGETEYLLDLTGSNNLQGLRDRINDLGAGVTATVVDTGDATGRYRLSLVSEDGQAVQLREVVDDGTTNILTGALLGTDATFKLNGLTITKPDNTVTGVVPGVTMNILGKTSAGEQVMVSLASNRASLSTAISNFVTAYNATVDAVNSQIGEDAGLLSGNSIIREIQNQLRGLTGYRSSGAIESLMDLGVELDRTGQMSFDTSVFNALSNSDITAAFNYFGSTSSGFGALNENFARISDPVSGLVQVQQARYDEADARLEDQIAALSERVSTMQTSLLLRLEQADALLASLESQQNILSSSIDSLNLVLYGKNDG